MIFKARLTEPLNIAGRTYPAGSVIELRIELVDHTTGLIDVIPEPIRVPRNRPQSSSLDTPPEGYPALSPPPSGPPRQSMPLVLEMQDIPENTEMTRRQLRLARQRQQDLKDSLDPERVQERAEAMRRRLAQEANDPYTTGTG